MEGSSAFICQKSPSTSEIAVSGFCHLTGSKCSKAVVSSTLVYHERPSPSEITVFGSCHLSSPKCNKAVVSSTLAHHERPSPSEITFFGFWHLSSLKNRLRWYHQLWYTTKDLVPVRWESSDAAISSVYTIVCGSIISCRILQKSCCQ
jgi:hypothetical protein